MKLTKNSFYIAILFIKLLRVYILLKLKLNIFVNPQEYPKVEYRLDS